MMDLFISFSEIYKKITTTKLLMDKNPDIQTPLRATGQFPTAPVLKLPHRVSSPMPTIPFSLSTILFLLLKMLSLMSTMLSSLSTVHFPLPKVSSPLSTMLFLLLKVLSPKSTIHFSLPTVSSPLPTIAFPCLVKPFTAPNIRLYFNTNP